MAVTVLLVEDVAELRAVVCQALRLRGGFEVVAEADDGSSAVEAAARHQPDIVVLDLGLPDLAGHEALARRFLARNCRQWGCEDAVEDAELVVSELVTNALLHAGARCILRAGLLD